MKTKKDTKKVSPFERAEAKLREAALNAAPGTALGSEVALAKDCDVSRMTARKAVDALVAEGLVERRAGIGLFVRDASAVRRRVVFLAGNLLWEPAIRSGSSARRVVAEAGMDFELRDAHGDMDSFISELEALPGSGAVGAVVVSPHGERADAALAELAETGFPAVVVDQLFGDDSLAGVASDNASGGAKAADCLASLGHARVAFVGDLEADTVKDRWEGFRGECAARGLPPPLKYDISGASRFADWSEGVAAAVERIVAMPRRPTAVFCSCDAVARLAMRAFAAKGVKIPEDVSLVGFDDDPIAEWTSPALTTIRQDFAAMGETAAKALLARLADPAAPVASQALPVALVVRESAVAAKETIK